MDAWQEPEPEGLWESLVRALPETAPAAPERAARRWWYAAPAFAVAMACAAFFIFSPRSAEHVRLVDAPRSVVAEAGRDDMAGHYGEPMPVEDNMQAGENSPVGRNAPARPALKDRRQEEAGEKGDEAVRAELVDVDGGREPECLQEEITAGRMPEKVSRPDTAGVENGSPAVDAFDYFPEGAEAAPVRKRLASLSFGFSGVSPSGSVLSAGQDAIRASGVPVEGFSDAMSGKYNVGVLLGDGFRQAETSRRYYQPVSFDLGVSCDLDRGFFVQSGLSYTCLVADMESETGGNSYDMRQTLHLVGVPLKFGYRLVDNNILEWNVNAGGKVEKVVAGKTSTGFSVNGSERTSMSSSIDSRPVYWSLSASTALMYKIGRNTGLFVEPGLSYYFDNGSGLESIHDTRPFNFRLSIGLRLSL